MRIIYVPLLVAHLQEVTLERMGASGGVAWLTLNKPEKLNALSMTMVRGMSDAIEEHWSVRVYSEEIGQVERRDRSELFEECSSILHVVETTCSGGLAPGNSDAPSAGARTFITNTGPWERSHQSRNRAPWLAG